MVYTVGLSKKLIGILTLFRLGGEGGGGGREEESARADFNFREIPWYLSNTNQMWQLLLKSIGEQDFGKNFASRVSYVAMATTFSTPCLLKFWLFKYFSPLINEIFKTRANY